MLKDRSGNRKDDLYGSEGIDESQRGHHRTYRLRGSGRPAHQPAQRGGPAGLRADRRLRGMVTDRDIVLRCVAAEEDPAQTLVRDIMTRGCTAVSPRDDCREATRLMSVQQVRRLPVVEDGRLVGIVSLADLARSQRFDMEAAQALGEISENIIRRRF